MSEELRLPMLQMFRVTNSLKEELNEFLDRGIEVIDLKIAEGDDVLLEVWYRKGRKGKPLLAYVLRNLLFAPWPNELQGKVNEFIQDYRAIRVASVTRVMGEERDDSCPPQTPILFVMIWARPE